MAILLKFSRLLSIVSMLAASGQNLEAGDTGEQLLMLNMTTPVTKTSMQIIIDVGLVNSLLLSNCLLCCLYLGSFASVIMVYPHYLHF